MYFTAKWSIHNHFQQCSCHAEPKHTFHVKKKHPRNSNESRTRNQSQGTLSQKPKLRNWRDRPSTFSNTDQHTIQQWKVADHWCHSEIWVALDSAQEVSQFPWGRVAGSASVQVKHLTVQNHALSHINILSLTSKLGQSWDRVWYRLVV